MKSVASYALGCKVNQYESEAIAELFEEKGYDVVGIDDKADVYVINTCTVTNFGDKKSRQLIRKVKRQNPDALVAVVGCYAQTAPDEVMKIEGVNIVIGTKDRKEIVSIVENYHDNKPENHVSPIMKEREFEHLKIHKLKNRTRAYLKIQDGCSQFCSYCIIPYARGPIRSRDPEDIMEEVNVLAQNGFKEIVLTGIHVASYGKDIKNIDLLGIIKRVHEVEGIERIRFSSIEPNIITEEFVSEIVKLKKVCHHFHLSLQSGCDKTLKDMNRKYTTEKYYDAVCILRKYMSDVAITTDIIVGFPGETEEDFNELYEFIKKARFDKLGTFMYSKEDGTPAEKLPNQINTNTKKSRYNKIMKEQQQISKENLELKIGKEYETLIESKTFDNKYLIGRTKQDVPEIDGIVYIKNDNYKSLENQIVNVKVTQVENYDLIGEII